MELPKIICPEGKLNLFLPNGSTLQLSWVAAKHGFWGFHLVLHV